MRVISNIFLKKSALGYIFNSKVANVQTHIKYRNKFLNSLKNPAAFDHIKDYWWFYSSQSCHHSSFNHKLYYELNLQ